MQYLRTRLFKRWIALSTGLDTTQRITQWILLILIHRIVINSVDSTIHLLNNRSQVHIAIQKKWFNESDWLILVTGALKC